ncbi:MAG: hypothetical protein WAO22_05525 [bacterium]
MGRPTDDVQFDPTVPVLRDGVVVRMENCLGYEILLFGAGLALVTLKKAGAGESPGCCS